MKTQIVSILIGILIYSNCFSQTNIGPFTFYSTNQGGTILGQAQINGAICTEGDVIAAFNSSGLCAGAQELIIFGDIAYINLLVYGDDGSGNGVAPGEVFYLKLWDASSNELIENEEAFAGWQNNRYAPMPGYDNQTLIYNFINEPPCSDPSADAGQDATICENLNIQLIANANNFESLLWETSGDGTFNNPLFLNPIYYPGPDDVSTGDVMLCLTAMAFAPCTDAVDCMSLTIQKEPITNAGSDATICENENFQLNASAENYESLQWVSDGDGSFDNPSILNPTYTPGPNDVDVGIVTLTLSASAVSPCSQSLSDDINLQIQSEPVVNAGIDATICENENIQLNAIAENYESLQWVSDGDGSFDNPSILNPTYTPGPNDVDVGIVTLTLSASAVNPCSLNVSDAISLQIQSEPMVNAGIDATICENGSYTLSNASAADYTTIEWAGGSGNFDDPASIHPTYTAAAGETGAIVLIMTVQPVGPCTTYVSDDMELFILANPSVDAGENAAICEDGSYTIESATGANYSEVLWTGGTGTFDNATILNPTYQTAAGETGTVALTISVQPVNPCISTAFDLMDLFIQTKPTVDAGENATICEDGNYAITTATATDYSTVEWTGGTGGFDNATNLSTTYQAGAGESGSVVLILTAQPVDPCTVFVFDEMELYIQPKPNVNAGVDATLVGNTSFSVTDATVMYSGGVLWTSNGDGTFNADDIIDPVYIFGESDVLGESVELCVFAEPISPCEFTESDCKIVTNGLNKQEITIEAGWSGISGFVQPVYDDINSVTAPYVQNIDMMWNYSGVFLPGWGVNTIGNWDYKNGYVIKVDEDTPMILAGNIAVDRTISLSEGWNIIPVLSESSVPSIDIFNQLGDTLIIAKEIAGINIYYPLYNISTLNTLSTGKAYFVKLTEDCEITFPYSNTSWQCGELLVDTRDYQTYSTVQIGTQCWMAENLNIGDRIDGIEEMTENSIIEKYCFNNDLANCETYGGLYQWNEMMQYTSQEGVQGICPDNWHIPTDDEWKILEGTVDSLYHVGDPEWDGAGWRGFDAGKNLKSTSGWDNSGNGTDLYGFWALPGGGRSSNGLFYLLVSDGYWWSSSKTSGTYAWTRRLYRNYNYSNRDDFLKVSGFSVRCLNDSSLQNLPPVIPSNPKPANDTTLENRIVILEWECTDPENDPIVFDIHIGTDVDPPIAATSHTQLTYDPGILENNTTYYWKIIARDDQGNITEGPVWNFTIDEEIIFNTCGDILVDSRDGQEYETVQIGDQCWMAKNLNIGIRIDGIEEMTENSIIEKYCYNDDSTHCDTYGGLYQWNEMMQYATQGVQGICPDNWHIPTDDEWKILEGTVDSLYHVGDSEWDGTGRRGFDAGKNLKSISGWYNNGNGSDLYGFSALPGGGRSSNGLFYVLVIDGYWWSSSVTSDTYAWSRILHFNDDYSDRGDFLKVSGFSVRCLNDSSFQNLPPVIPSNPKPANDTTLENRIVILEWECTDPENDPMVFDVHIGTDFDPPIVATSHTQLTYDPGILESDTTYYWKIIARDDQGNITEGPVWNITIDEEIIFNTCGDILVDSRDGQEYETAQIGDQCWMAENLNIGTRIDGVEEMTENSIIEKYCYYDDSTHCDTYGGLYQWKEMMQYTAQQGIKGICPDGWHIPSDEEWKELEGEVDSQYGYPNPEWDDDGWRGLDVGLNMKSTSGWSGNGNGNDHSGFSALAGGNRIINGNFYHHGTIGIWWSSSEYSTGNAWGRELGCYWVARSYRNYYNEWSGYSVRCLRDQLCSDAFSERKDTLYY